MVSLDELGRLHSFDDKPSIITPNGTQYWHNYGVIHRENGPAIKTAKGYQFFYQNGKCHREGDPAVIFNEFLRSYYLKGKLEKIEDDLNEIYEFFKEGRRHRENDLPAYISPIEKKWYFDNKLHCLSGPSVLNLKSGDKQFYIEGIKYNEKEYWRIVKELGV